MEKTIVFTCIITIAICIITIAILGGRWLTTAIEKSERRKRGQRMIGKAKWYGARLVRNIDHDICAVASQTALEEGLAAHYEKIRSGQIDPWDPVVVYANPTFTFASSTQTSRPIHTGVVRDLDNWLAFVLKEITGVCCDQVSKADYEAAIEAIMPRDRRLFVPYSGSANKEQFDLYGKRTLDEFNCMMRCIFP